MAVEEHMACTCVDANSINVTTDVVARSTAKLRERMQVTKDEELTRAIRSVAPTSSVSSVNSLPTSSVRATAASAASKRRKSSTRELGPDGDVTPTEHEIVYYKTCLACKEQQDSCAVRERDDNNHCHHIGINAI